jgi:hypothetical protein
MTFHRRGIPLLAGFVVCASACAPSGRGERGSPALPTAHTAGQGPGPAVGEKLPEFEAADQTGRVWTFESLRGPKGLLLNINRSVVW